MACARTHNHTHFTNRATKRAPSVGSTTRRDEGQNTPQNSNA